MEVVHLVHQEAVRPAHLAEAPLVHHAPEVHPDLPEAVHLQVVHQSAAAHQAEALQAVVLAVHQREAALLVEDHQREVALLVAAHLAVALEVHQSAVVHLVAVHLAVVLAALPRKAVLLAVARPVQNVEDLQVQSAVLRSETHKLDLIQSRG